MPLRDFINGYNFNADEFDFDAFKAAVEQEYSTDEGVWNSKVSELEGERTKTAAELLTTKARNWDLLKQIPGDSDSKSGAPLPDADQPEISIDDLFGKKEE